MKRGTVQVRGEVQAGWYLRVIAATAKVFAGSWQTINGWSQLTLHIGAVKILIEEAMVIPSLAHTVL